MAAKYFALPITKNLKIIITDNNKREKHCSYHFGTGRSGQVLSFGVDQSSFSRTAAQSYPYHPVLNVLCGVFRQLR